ncbi:MAG: PfkB family carbohydrate kinase [Oscillospiraceae bacterium]|nr:PfkB family carbohydrate kinase [Oscillospiraceae bacterium]
MKKLAVIQDISGLGRCSLGAALPVISAMGVHALPVPTAVYTNQTGFSRFAALGCEPLLGKYPSLWQEHGVTLDGILTGFMGTHAQLAAAQTMINTFRTPDTLLLIDPVMGDNGQLYPVFDDDFARAIADFARQADVITPNVTELCLLAGECPMTFLRAPPDEQRRMIIQLCAALPQPTIIVTGWKVDDLVFNAAWQHGKLSSYSTSAVAGSYSGTGDLFAATVCAGLVRGDALQDCITRAAKFLHAALTEAAQRNLPPKHGVPFEHHLKELLL